MLKKLIVTIVGLLVVFGFLAGIKALQIGALIAAGKSSMIPPDAVTTAEVKSDQWRPVVTAVGTVTAVQGVTLSTEVPGLVKRIAFESGATVAQGDVLVELDSSTEQAQLRAAEAGAELARLNLDRARELLAKNTISRSELDAAVAQSKEAAAQVDNLQAVIAKKTLRAPFAGRLGIRQVNLGQYLTAGAAIISLQSMDPVYVDFFLPQQQLAVIRAGLDVEVGADAAPDAAFKGSVTAIASEVEQATRNIKLQATLPNRDGLLRPGMFVNVRVLQDRTREVLAVPATAILYASYGNSLFVVEKNPAGEGFVAAQRFVRLGETRGDFVEVTEGVASGDVVVTNGAFKLRNGSAVSVHNDKAPAVELAPTPSDT